MKPTALQLDRCGKLKLSEADVTKQCIDFLRAHGWRCIRLETKPVIGPGGHAELIGERGQPDWLALRVESPGTAVVSAIFIEFKAPGRKPTRKQIEWHEQAQRDGFEVWVIDSLEWLIDLLEALQEHMPGMRL